MSLIKKKLEESIKVEGILAKVGHERAKSEEI